MIALIIVLSLLLVAAIGFIFYLTKVFFSTFFSTFEVSHKNNRPPIEEVIRKAYDGKYYPATVIATTKYEQEYDGIITDFSLYEEKKIIGFTIYTTNTLIEHLKEGASILNKDLNIDEIPEEILDETFNKPTIFKNAIVFSPTKGVWTWESLE